MPEPASTPSLEDALEKARSLTDDKGDKIPEDKPEESEVEAESEEKSEKPIKAKKSEKVERSDKVEEPKTEDNSKESKKEKETLEHIDPKEIPAELQPVYKNLMAGFTKGRQQDRAEVIALKKELEEIKKSQVKPEAEELPKFNTPQEYYAWEAKRTAEEVVKNERLESWRQQAIDDYNASDDRLNDKSDNHDPITDAVIGSQLDRELDKHIADKGSEIGFDYKSHIKRLLGEWDQYVDSKIKNYISRQNKLMEDKAKDFQKKSLVKSNPAKTTFSKKLTLQEAMQAALDK